MIIILFLLTFLVCVFCFVNKLFKIERGKFYLFLSFAWILTSLLVLYSCYYLISIFFSLFLLFFLLKRKKYKVAKFLLFGSLVVSFFITLLIMLSVLIQSVSFFDKVSILDFFFSLKWKHGIPTVDQKSVSYFGIAPLLIGTLLITIVAMLIVIPLGLFSAIYISEYASRRTRYVVNTTLQILSAIPTVVYGYFSIVFLSVAVRQVASFFGLDVHTESALVAGLSIGIMIIPFFTSLSEDAIRSVPKNLRYGFMALGATTADTVWHIILPYSMSTILSAILLSISRVIGETMIVLMAVGVNANLTFNPLHSVTTITVQIATLLTGDQDFSSAQTLSAYALSLVLFVMTWILNAFALFMMKRN